MLADSRGGSSDLSLQPFLQANERAVVESVLVTY